MNLLVGVMLRRPLESTGSTKPQYQVPENRQPFNYGYTLGDVDRFQRAPDRRDRGVGQDYVTSDSVITRCRSLCTEIAGYLGAYGSLISGIHCFFYNPGHFPWHLPPAPRWAPTKSSRCSGAVAWARSTKRATRG